MSLSYHLDIRSSEFRLLDNGGIIVSGVTGKGIGREISGAFYARLDSTLTVEVFNQIDLAFLPCFLIVIGLILCRYIPIL
jgi:hypothetical protein